MSQLAKVGIAASTKEAIKKTVADGAENKRGTLWDYPTSVKTEQKPAPKCGPTGQTRVNKPIIHSGVEMKEGGPERQVGKGTSMSDEISQEKCQNGCKLIEQSSGRRRGPA